MYTKSMYTHTIQLSYSPQPYYMKNVEILHLLLKKVKKKKSMQYRLDMEEWIFSCCRHVCVVRWW